MTIELQGINPSKSSRPALECAVMSARIVEGWRAGKIEPEFGLLYSLSRIADQLIAREVLRLMITGQPSSDQTAEQRMLSNHEPEKFAFWVEDDKGNISLRRTKF